MIDQRRSTSKDAPHCHIRAIGSPRLKDARVADSPQPLVWSSRIAPKRFYGCKVRTCWHASIQKNRTSRCQPAHMFATPRGGEARQISQPFTACATLPKDDRTSAMTPGMESPPSSVTLFSNPMLASLQHRDCRSGAGCARSATHLRCISPRYSVFIWASFAMLATTGFPALGLPIRNNGNFPAPATVL